MTDQMRHPDVIAALRAAEPKSMRLLRWLLAVTWAREQGVMLYTDDGEYSDSSAVPVIDFRRDHPEDIERAMQTRLANRRPTDSAEGRDGYVLVPLKPTYDRALNSAGWAMLEAWDTHMTTPRPTEYFNNAKQIFMHALRAWLADRAMEKEKGK